MPENSEHVDNDEEHDITALIHDVKAQPEAAQAEKSSGEITLLPEPPKKIKKLRTIREKTTPMVKKVYSIIFKKTEGNYRLIGRTIRMLYKVYLAAKPKKEPVILDDTQKNTAVVETPNQKEA